MGGGDGKTATGGGGGGLAPASLQAALGALNMLTDRSPTKNDLFLHHSMRSNSLEADAARKSSSSPRPTGTGARGDNSESGEGKSPRKDATPVFKKKIERGEGGAVGRRTTYYFLPEKVENQLLESR